MTVNNQPIVNDNVITINPKLSAALKVIHSMVKIIKILINGVANEINEVCKTKPPKQHTVLSDEELTPKAITLFIGRKLKIRIYITNSIKFNQFFFQITWWL